MISPDHLELLKHGNPALDHPVAWLMHSPFLIRILVELLGADPVASLLFGDLQ